MLKDLDRQRDYESMFEMHATRGWAAFVEAAAERRAALNDVRDIKDIDELRGRQGQLFILDWILSHKSGTEAMYATELASQEEDGVA